jgi:hypothetical protein
MCCVEPFFFFLKKKKLTGYDLIFKDFFFFKVGQIYFLFFNLGSFYSNLAQENTKNTKNK